jgi:hypothetical protein
MPRNIIFYTTETGKRPVEEFLDSLKSKEAQKILGVLTHGYAKKSQRTDAREIKLAEKYRSGYLARRRPT